MFRLDRTAGGVFHRSAYGSFHTCARKSGLMTKRPVKPSKRAKAQAARKKLSQQRAADPDSPVNDEGVAVEEVIGRPDLPWSERATLVAYFPPDGERTEDYVLKITVLEGLCAGMTISAAASRAGIGRTKAVQWQTEHDQRWFDPALKVAWVIAINETGAEFYENEVRRRATIGTLRPVFQQGECVGHIREFSDNLLIMATKARLPNKYRENVHTTGNMTINVTNRDERHLVKKDEPA